MREPLGIRASPALVELLLQAGDERAGSLVALAVIGASHVGLSLGNIHEDVAAAMSSPLEQTVREALVRAYAGTGRESSAPAAPAAPAAPLVRRDEPPEDDGGSLTLEF
jgi:hypothetical protein